MRTAADLRQARIHSVKELIAHRLPTLTRITDQTARQSFWNAWLAAHLPAEIGAHLVGVVEREGRLVIFAESAAWSARLRYALRELEAPLRAAELELADISVRVRPRL